MLIIDRNLTSSFSKKLCEAERERERERERGRERGREGESERRVRGCTIMGDVFVVYSVAYDLLFT